MRLKELVTKGDNDTLCEVRVLGVFGAVADITGGFLALPALEIGGGVAAIITALGGAIRLRGSD